MLVAVLLNGALGEKWRCMSCWQAHAHVDVYIFGVGRHDLLEASACAFPNVGSIAIKTTRKR